MVPIKALINTFDINILKKITKSETGATLLSDVTTLKNVKLAKLRHHYVLNNKP